MEQKIKEYRIIVCILLMILYAIVLGIIYKFATVDIFIQSCILAALLIFAYEIYCICRNTKEIFHPAIVFLFSYYIFQNGQLLLLSLNIPFNRYYINLLIEFLPQVALFSSVSVILAGFAGVIVVKSKHQKRCRISIADGYTQVAISNAAMVGLIFTGAVAVPLIFIKFFGYSLNGGYSAVQAFEGKLPSIVGLIEYMYIPFVILYLVFSDCKKDKQITKVVFVIWCILTALCGDRTTGIAGILIVALIGYLLTENYQTKKRMAIKVVVFGIFGLLLVNIARMFRNSGSIDITNKDSGGFIINFISELGFSVFPLFTMMNIVPSKENFLFGEQYVASFFRGIIPSTLDVTGIVAKLTESSHIHYDWTFKYYPEFKFGIDSSLNTEAYINFGWFGLIAIFVVCCFIMYCLTNNYIETPNGKKYGIYKTLVLLFVWFTLPRRTSFTIWNGLFWCVFMMGIYLKIICVPKTAFLDKNKYNQKKYS